MHKRLLAIPLAIAAAATIAVVATNTGADFSGTSNAGTVRGTTASVAVQGADGNNMDLTFPGVLVPGTPSTVNVTFANTGNIAEDIYVIFPNAQALHAFNQQGRFAQANIAVDGTVIWTSGNLNDGFHTGDVGPFNCSTPTNAGDPQICPLDETRLLANVGGGDHTFTFTYMMNSSQTSVHNVGNAFPNGRSTQNAPFNPYPVNAGGDVYNGSTSSGLPYAFYAVQAGGTAPATDISNAIGS